MLFERGLLAPCPCCDADLRLSKSTKAPDNPDHTWARKNLRNLPEFANQKSVLEQAVLDRGHIVIYSPICHPEVSVMNLHAGLLVFATTCVRYSECLR